MSPGTRTRGCARTVRRPRAGFTLIELLVALFITAILFVIGYGTIDQALKDRSAIDAHARRLAAVENAVQVMVQDFTQITPRPVRDETGESSLPCLIASPSGVSVAAQSGGLGSTGTAPGSAGSSGLDLVAFTRAGWANPAGIQRPEEERVAYRLVNGVLERLSSPELDTTESTPVVTRKLLDHVQSLSFEYLDPSLQWTDEWPPLVNAPSSPVAGNASLRMRPLAVRITLVLDDWGKIVRIVEVPT